MYKIITGKEGISCQQFFQQARDCYGLTTEADSTVENTSSVRDRLVNGIDSLKVVDTPSVNAFKNRLDHFWTDVST